MIESHRKLSRVRQCELLRQPRLSYYYQPWLADDAELALLCRMDTRYLKTLRYGSRSNAAWFQRQGVKVGWKKAVSMMKILGVVNIAPKPNASASSRQHKIYPYLHRSKGINQPNQIC